MSRRTPPAVTATLSASALLLTAFALTACQVPETEPEPTASAPTASGTPTTGPEPSDTPEPAPEPTAIPVGVACDALMSAQAMYDFNPNFSLLASWTPDAGSAAADARAAEGVACRWKNDTSGETIDVSVASYDAATLERIANDAYGASTMVPTYGDEAYFDVANGTGEAVVFERAYLVVVSSSYFLEPGDAEPIVNPVLAALP